MTAADLMRIDALGPDGAYQTRNREPVATTAGVAVAEQRTAMAQIDDEARAHPDTAVGLNPAALVLRFGT